MYGQRAQKLAPILSMISLAEFGSHKRYRWIVACLTPLRLQTFVGAGVVTCFFDSRDNADSRARTITNMLLNGGSARERKPYMMPTLRTCKEILHQASMKRKQHQARRELRPIFSCHESDSQTSVWDHWAAIDTEFRNNPFWRSSG